LKKLTPTHRAMDDALVAAIAAMQGDDIVIPKSGREIRLNYGTGAPCGLRELFARSISTGERTGPKRDLHVHAWFGTSGEITYWRQDGVARVSIMDELLPDTLAAASQGRPLLDVIDLPGLGDWMIASTEHSAIDGQHTFTLAPPTNP